MTHTAEQTPAPVVSRETLLLELIDRCEAEKLALADELKAAMKKASDIDAQRQKLDYKLSDAEQRLKISAGSAGVYRDTMRAQALGRLMMGDETVKLDELPDSDPMSTLSAGDLKLGIEELRRQRAELGRSWDSARSRVGALEKKFYTLHAKANGARYEMARNAAYNAWVEVLAAESCSQKHALHAGIAQFVGEGFWNLVLPPVDGHESMAEIRPAGRAGGAEFRGENVRLTGLVNKYAGQLAGAFAEMTK